MELHVEIVDANSKWYAGLIHLFRAGNLPTNTIHDIMGKGQGFTIWLSDRSTPICMCTLQKMRCRCDAWMIDNIVTRPEYRGKGLASKLLRHIIQEYGQDELRLEAKQDLIDYYSKFGFQRTKRSIIYDSCTYFEMVN